MEQGIVFPQQTWNLVRASTDIVTTHEHKPHDTQILPIAVIWSLRTTASTSGKSSCWSPVPLQQGAVGLLDKRCFRKCIDTRKTSRVYFILFHFLEIVSEGSKWQHVGGEEYAPETARAHRVLVTPLLFRGEAISAGLSTCLLTQLPSTRLEQKTNTTSAPTKSTSICAPSRKPTEPNICLRLKPITAEDTPTRPGSVGDMQMHAGAWVPVMSGRLLPMWCSSEHSCNHL